MKSWGIEESSSLFREYFESSIMNNVEVKDMYWNPTWKLDKVIPWLVEVVDRVYSEDVSRDFDRLCQKMWKLSFQNFRSWWTC